MHIKKTKEKYIKSEANRIRKYLPDYIFNALITWEINIDDKKWNYKNILEDWRGKMSKPISNIKTYGINTAIKCSKYPMSANVSYVNGDITPTVKNLASSNMGEGHDNFLCGIVAQFNLTFTNKAWVEAERYHFFDIISSQSTMHRIYKMDIEENCNEYVDKIIIQRVEELKNKYLETQDSEDYLTLLYNVPSGFKITAGITTNYRQLKTIYHQRKNHRLPEWRLFCKQLEEEFPMFKELVLGDS